MSVTTYRNDNARTGQNLQETVLTPANVNMNSFGKLVSYQLPDDSFVYAQPLLLSNVSVPGQGKHNLLFIPTEHDVLYAFDADGTTSTPLWTADLAAAVGGTPVPSAEVFGDGLAPELGISSTPVIDRATGTIYVVAFTKQGAAYFQHLHALDVATGAEKFGGPAEIQASVPGTGDGGDVVVFNPATQNQRPALLLSQGQLYLTWGSFDDHPLYHGWIMSYDSATLQQTGIFNTTPDSDSGSAWILGALTADQNGNIFTVTGNGTFSEPAGGRDYGESFLKFSSNLGLADFFTPFNFDALNSSDVDLGSGGPLIVPDQPDSAKHLMIGTGKEGRIYLIDRDNMGQFNPDADQILQEIPNAFSNCVINECMFSTPGYWQQNVYFLPSGNALQQYQLRNGQLSNTPIIQANTAFQGHGATVSVSANGGSDGIVWALRVDDSTANAGSAILYAYDAGDVSNELYNSNQNFDRDDPGQGENFIVPTIANGKVYVATRAQVSVYGLLSSPALPDFSISAAPQTLSVAAGSNANATVKVSGLSGFNGTVTLNANGVPPGTTVHFAPGNVVGSGSSTILISTASTTPSGNYPVTIIGTSGSLTHSDSFTLNVTAVVVGNPDFTILTSPATVTVRAGQSASYSIAIGSQNGFTGTVNLSCSGAPSNSTCALSPAAVPVNSAGATSTLKVTTSGPNAAAMSPGNFAQPSSQGNQWAWMLSGTFAMFGLFTSGRSRKRKVAAILCLVLIVGLSGIAISCGGGGSANMAPAAGSPLPPPPPPVPPAPLTPAGTYTINVVAASGSIQHSTSVQLVVQ